VRHLKTVKRLSVCEMMQSSE